VVVAGWWWTIAGWWWTICGSRLRGTTCDGVVLGHSFPHSHGNIVVDRIGIGVILMLNLGLGCLASDIVSLGGGHCNIALAHNGIGDIVSLCVCVSDGDCVGEGVALCVRLGYIHSCGLSEVLFICVIAIASCSHVLGLSHHLGISEDLPLGDDCRLSIGSHGRCEDHSLGSHHSLSYGGKYGSGVFLSDSGILHAGSLHILGHGLGDMFGVAVFHRGRGTVGCRRRSI